ncbi:CoA transferase [Lentzea sp. BCCO 10_0061]|uniref:CoA transferase n=1 Tax=Lentzea sokolovensis TaxID=3095429 RepID=A0ABU4V6W8_9PSEU|nr:CoA transferase [Lentzea sp. BCCO 10_0061]MDX8147538.1 CoA transferase [Lentzea sp. BCCO 10_0061]
MTLHLDRTTSDPPLSATEITVRGDSAAAGVLGALLHQSGASVSRFPDAGGEPAHVEAAAELAVSWAGPVRGGEVTDEASAQAVCGPMHVHGRSQGSPRGLGLDYCATAAGVIGGTGLLAALFDGRSSVTTSVAQSALTTVSQYLAAAGAPEAEATALEPGGPPFRSADGVLFEIEALDPAVWQAFWAGLGVPGRVIGAGWRPFQFRYPTATAPLPAELHAAAEARTFAELKAHADATAMSICHLHEPNSTDGPAFELATLDFKGGRDRVRGSLPLSGLVVLEAGRRVQAPLAAHLLGLLGATVVRVEPPGGDPLRGMPPMCGDASARWLALNRGKSAVEIDIKDPPDRDRLRDLVRTADVFLHNWAPGTAERLGVGAHDLAAVNPALVFVHTSGWAGRLPDAPLGTDFMAQARTGLGALLRSADEPPAPSLMTLLDVLGGLLGAYTTVAALLQRERTGRAIRAESSLLAAAELLRLDAKGRPAAGFRRPLLGDGGWIHEGVPVTDDLASISTDPRFADVVALDQHRCPEVLTPWRFR